MGGGPAGNVLVQPVVHLFNRVIQEGYPEGWRVGAICPVPKKAGATEMDEHRGIVVGPLLAVSSCLPVVPFCAAASLVSPLRQFWWLPITPSVCL